MPAPHEITPKQLLRRIGLPDAPTLIDVRIPEDLCVDPRIIPGAICHDHQDVDGLIARLSGPAVIACQKGLKLSQGLASRLRARGIAAEFLSGGMLAWLATPDAPTIDFANIPNPSLWVTRHRPKIDRIACPWLIRRFVDPRAEILYVAPDQVLAVAERFNAVPFDVPGAPLTHNGDACTFDALLEHFGLDTQALGRIARVVRAADTGTVDVPQAAGLLAVSVGLSRMYRDDHQQLDAAMPIYDALYRWARDGMDETHDSRGTAQ